MRPVNSWGRLSADAHDVIPLTDLNSAPVALRGEPGRDPHDPNAARGLAHGMGRSYGDACLNPGGVLWTTTGLDHLIAFDAETGRLVCEAGVLLRDIQRLFIARGWMLPVTPGTQLVTVGGAIANDVHGKNHHAVGSFGDHVLRLTLARTNGELIECGPDLNREWFAATVGGLGLTGVILKAELQLRRTAGPWLDTETLPFASLAEFFPLADASEADWEHTVAWIDCVGSAAGRGLFMRANTAAVQATERRVEPRAKNLPMPLVPPVSLVNRLTLPPFNAAYFHLKKWRAGRALAHYEPFFYPLDSISDWNRMYGPKGFYQYQSVVPRAAGFEATQAMLGEIAKSGNGSFLAVLKTFGNRYPVGMLSFPQPGVTLALDFPNQGASTLALFERLDAIVREAGGRIYPAKDARMPRDLFEAGYPALADFSTFRDPGISSGLSRRLMGS
ncbi:FAD-binding oxidoreductase [Paraburkholderia acidisoli]|uniref:FAD-binding protein n=1 Tax=Paraburkholderia acidisoli TaxID=2571748 RepID=A0A7Z2GFI5_9BURK|nr:FAD-binding oxidoreductase [Paraburkholderia acidisoli]QGZ60810.1 FAD-binding protein [Paraburkholderia acidisoli]